MSAPVSGGAEAQPVKRPRGRPRKIRDGSAPEARPKKPAKTGARKITDQKAAASAIPKPEDTVADAISPEPISALKYVYATGRRKRAVARVFFYLDGKSEIEVNGKPLKDYFTAEMLREIIDQPLRFSSVRKSARIAVKVRGGGIRGQAEATRLGIARALLKLDENLRPVLRSKGYLTRDPREKERKKPGLKRARRGPQWAKR
ncbi:30S ribosomal protein S9 [Candidatus Uhrbacteria bacterium]|nr:30S ribosomal protein S9 [Candidatus Uhrbacteria bacterium]